MSFEIAKLNPKIYESKTGHYIFECNELSIFYQQHFLPTIIHLKMPHSMGGSSISHILLVRGTESSDDFQIYLQNIKKWKGSFQKLFETRTEGYEDEKVNLMYGKYPIQLEVCPFLVANFETHQFPKKELSKLERELTEKFNKKFDVQKTIVFHYG